MSSYFSVSLYAVIEVLWRIFLLPNHLVHRECFLFLYWVVRVVHLKYVYVQFISVFRVPNKYYLILTPWHSCNSGFKTYLLFWFTIPVGMIFLAATSRIDQFDITQHIAGVVWHVHVIPIWFIIHSYWMKSGIWTVGLFAWYQTCVVQHECSQWK